MRVNTLGQPISQPKAIPKEVAPTKTVLSPSLYANGPPESPLQVDLPPVVLMQMFVDLTEPTNQRLQTVFDKTGTSIQRNILVTAVAAVHIARK